MSKKIYSFVLAGLFAGGAFAQPTLKTLKTRLETKGSSQPVAKLELSEKMNFLGSLKFESGTTLSKAQAINWLQQELQLRSGKDALQNIRSESTNMGVEVQTVQQFYRGIKVEHGRVKITSAANRVSTMQLEFYPLPDNIATTPSITEATALQKAMTYIGAEKYVWEGYTGNDPELQRPVGELVYVQDMYEKLGEMTLAYKFSIEAEKPLSKAFIYIDAITGKTVFYDKIIKHINATGSADTRYSGTQTIVADQRAANVFRLREQRNGDSIITLNYQRLVRSTANDAAAVDFIDSNNVWSAAEFNNANYDDAGLDAHWGIEKVSDYWNLVQGRAGWDNNHAPMRSYVHVRASATVGYDNAFWGGAAMYYGDGTYLSGNANGFRPLTALDVTAHELGHAVCQSTASLVYQRESGGLNEGFSDIWGAAVEHYSGLGGFKQNFKIGEEISPNQSTGFLRDMQNPNAGNQADTYFGSLWYPTTLAGCPVPNSNTNDNCGVHYNSGVLNKWFYIIVQGENATNDFGNVYSITGLGWAKAEKIAYLTELNLTPNADYAATRTASINAATTLYGACSNEVIQVTNAWFAVGVGASSNCLPRIEFVRGTTTVAEGTGKFAGCTSTTINIPIKLGTTATAATTLTFTVAGTAVNNVNFALPSNTLTFNVGETTKNLPVTIYNNAAIDIDRSITLSYSVNANGGNALAGVNNQTHTITITNEDGSPAAILSSPISSQATLLIEDFEATPNNFPSGFAQLNYGGVTNTSNYWRVGGNGGTGITGQSLYITNDTTIANRPLAYNAASSADRLIRLRPFNSVGYTNLKLRFKYKVEGEYSLTQIDANNPAALYDFGRISYATVSTATVYPFITDPASGDPVVLYGRGTGVYDTTINLPAALANQPTAYLAFRWTNDASAGSNPPLLIDDIIVTGQPTAVGIETTANQPAAGTIPGGAYTSYLYSAADSQLVARIANPSQNLGCVEASLTAAGNGQRSLNTGTGTFNGTQKVIQITPAISNTSATYTATLYYTAAELAVWGANKTNLKFLKVRDGVSLSSPLNSTNASIVLPTSVADSSATTGIIAYTGNFTGFSQFILVDPNTTLPISLGDFTVALKNRNAELNWNTTQEVNNKGFEILRSLDGVNFESIGFVAGRINSTTGAAYTFNDAKVPVNITVYYKLRQVDLDGKATLSRVLSVKLNDKGAFVYQVWPNPASSQVNITFDGGIKSGIISLIDQQGRKLITKTISQPTAKATLTTSALAAGTYMLQIDNGEVVETQKLVIKR